MSQRIGMDAGMVRQAATAIDTAAGELDRLVGRTDGLVAIIAGSWQGPDATAFHEGWVQRHRPALTGLGGVLHNYAKVATTNAAAQDQTSAAGTAGVGPGGSGSSAAPMSSWQQDAQKDMNASGYQQDVNQFDQLISTARQRALTTDEAAQLYALMQRHTWWFTNVPPTAAGASSPLSVEQARLAFWGLFSASTVQGTGDYYSRSLNLINTWMTDHRPSSADPTSPDYQTWVQSQANLAGLMNCAPNFDTERQVSTLTDYATDIDHIGHNATDAIGVVDVLHGGIEGDGAFHPSDWRPQGPDGKFIPFDEAGVANLPGAHTIVDFNQLNEASAGVAANASLEGVANQAMDTGIAWQESNWRTDAHYYEQFGMQNVVQEVNRATLQDLATRGGVSLPSDWQSWNLQQQLDWSAHQAPPDVGNLIQNLDQRVAANTGLHH